MKENQKLILEPLLVAKLMRFTLISKNIFIIEYAYNHISVHVF